MSEWRHADAQGQPVFDDDRLLAFALGLDDDPELEAAAGRDDALRRRLAEMRAEVTALGDQIQDSVPPVDESYADPMDPRWAGMREYFAPPKARRSRTSRWLRVLAPAAAVAVALAVGVGIFASQSSMNTQTMGGEGSASSAEDSRQPNGAVDSTDDGVGWSGTSGEQKELEMRQRRSLARQAERFGIVVVARAARVVGDVQRFSVVRVLKGDAPDALSLAVVDEPAKRGALHVLFLDPTTPDEAAEAPEPGASQPGEEATAPAASPTASSRPDEAPVFGSSPSPHASGKPPDKRVAAALARPIAFRFAGAKAVALRLPAGFDLTTLRLP